MRLDSVCELISRGTAPAYVDDSPIRVIGQRCVREWGFDASATRGHDPRALNVLRAKTGDVLLNSTGAGTIGRSCVFGEVGDFVVDSHVTILRPALAKINPRWMEMLLRSPWGQRYLEAHCFTGSTNQVELSRSELVSTVVPVPPVAEQRRIAEVLDAVDHQDAMLEACLKKKEVIVGGLISSLLDSVSSVESELSSFLSGPPKNGYSPVEVDNWTGVKALGLSCLTPRGFRPVQLKNVPSGDSRNRAAMLANGDLLISRANTRELVGLAGIYRDVGAPCIYPDLMMRVTTSAQCLPEFLELQLLEGRVRRQIQAMAQGTSESMVKINSRTVMELRVRIPELAEQRRILGIVAAARSEVESLYQERQRLRLLKQGLADDLLTGRTKVA
ncbi:restriction endonuclease subunit S [Actinomadura logoneensis]|nr:restriction endonuclease subunit S [Actinomadura logoneensis]